MTDRYSDGSDRCYRHTPVENLRAMIDDFEREPYNSLTPALEVVVARLREELELRAAEAPALLVPSAPPSCYEE